MGPVPNLNNPPPPLLITQSLLPYLDVVRVPGGDGLRHSRHQEHMAMLLHQHRVLHPRHVHSRRPLDEALHLDGPEAARAPEQDRDTVLRR